MTDLSLPAPPASARLLVLTLSGLVAASALAGIAAAIFGVGQPIVGMLGFEIVTMIAAGIGVLAGLGRFRDGWPLATVCTAGTVVVASGLAWIDARANFGSKPDIARLLDPALGFRVAAAAMISLGGAYAILSRDPAKSRPLLVRAIIVAAPLAIVIVWAAVTRGQLLLTPRAGAAEVVRLVVLIGGSLTLAVLFSVATHLVIRAFEVCSHHAQPES